MFISKSQFHIKKKSEKLLIFLNLHQLRIYPRYLAVCG